MIIAEAWKWRGTEAAFSVTVPTTILACGNAVIE
jgi:hypothetical protein